MLVNLFYLSVVALASAQHRSPPGVNPQHYQGQPQQYQQPVQQQQYAANAPHAPGVPPPQQHHQPPPPQAQQYQTPPQQQHQVPQQQHQVPQQQHQVPQQQHQVPQQQHQVPQQQQGQQFQQQPQHRQAAHHQPHQQKVFHANNLKEESAHIKDHLDVPLDTSRMSEQELQYHYFKMHDADNNNKLDGQELIKSLFHWHDSANHDAKSEHPPPEHKIFTDSELVNMIDPILEQDDRNKDGFIDYPEFVQAQRNANPAPTT